MELFQNFRQKQGLGFTNYPFLALFYMYLFVSYCFGEAVKLEVTLAGETFAKNGKLKEMVYQTKCYLVYPQLK